MFLRSIVSKHKVGIVAAAVISVSQRHYVSCNGRPNPLMKKDSLPLFAEITPSDVLPAVEADLKDLKAKFSEFEIRNIEKPVSPTYNSVIENMEVMQHPLSYSWGITKHLMGVKNSDELRNAHNKIQPSVIAINQRIGQSKELFKTLQELKRNDNVWKNLDECQKRIVDAQIKSMESSGVGLPESSREKFNKLQLELAELSTKFSNNLLDSTKQFKLILTNKEDIEGLPESAKALAAQQAQVDDKTATTENGPWVITLDLPSYLPAMQHLKNREIREKLYRAYVSRASEKDTDKNNIPIIQRILQIKYELSQMLGYQCHAEKSLSRKMASNVDEVMKLIEMLREKSYPYALKDLEDVREYAKSHLQQQQTQQVVNIDGADNNNDNHVNIATIAANNDYELQLWDIPYWSERLREAKYNYKEEELRPYFPLPSVLKGLFQLANRLFDITIESADGEVQVWHPDVRFFKIKDNKTGEHIASFYLDPFSRPSEKRGGAWMAVCQGKSKALEQHIPVAYLTCNGSPPVGEQPSLMTFREVETLFHEFGHGLQHMLTRVEHGDAAGIANIEWDAVELPSQFMENWCYDRPTLNAFARHYETNEPLPEELFQKIKAAKNYQSGMQMIRQLFFGAMDMYLHSKEYNPYGPRTPFDIQHELAKKYTVISPLPEDRFLCSFSHIFAGGYSAGYYSYKWAEVMSADAFAAFEEVGLQNEQEVKNKGQLFRDTVLSLGGGRHPRDVFRDFRGRDPKPDALLRHSGLN